MAVFLLSTEDDERIKRAADEARKHPITLDMLKRFGARTPDTKRFKGDRPKWIPHPQEVVLPFGWRLNISYEEQPGGAVLHLSMSSPTPEKTLPRIEAMDMVLKSLGYDPEITPSRFWVEEYFKDDGSAGLAGNLLIPATPPQRGHA